jgi:hypothetical protein
MLVLTVKRQDFVQFFKNAEYRLDPAQDVDPESEPEPEPEREPTTGSGPKPERNFYKLGSGTENFSTVQQHCISV